MFFPLHKFTKFVIVVRKRENEKENIIFCYTTVNVCTWLCVWCGLFYG